MAAHEAVKVSKKQVDDAQSMWHNFAIGMKYSIYAIVALLIALAAAFVKF